MSELATYDTLAGELAALDTVEEVADFRHKVDAVARYARVSGASREEVNRFAELKVRSEWKAGRLVDDLGRAPGRPQKLSESTTISDLATNLGVHRDTVHRWRVIALLTTAELESYFAEARDDERRTVTSADAYRLGLKHKPRSQRSREREPEADPAMLWTMATSAFEQMVPAQRLEFMAWAQEIMEAGGD